MKTYRTAAQWLELLQKRSNFKGTNIEFCQHHNVAITTYYKQRALPLSSQTQTYRSNHLMPLHHVLFR